jgi:hypothetical protein
MKVIFNAERIQFGRLIEIRWLTRDYDGTEAVATKVEYTKLTPDSYGEHHAAPLAMSADLAQGLMDELWRVGLRPTEGTGSAGSLAATERHLADMKSIAFHALKIGGR